MYCVLLQAEFSSSILRKPILKDEGMLKASSRYLMAHKENVSHLDIAAYIPGKYRRGRQAKDLLLRWKC